MWIKNVRCSDLLGCINCKRFFYEEEAAEFRPQNCCPKCGEGLDKVIILLPDVNGDTVFYKVSDPASLPTWYWFNLAQFFPEYPICVRDKIKW